MTDTKVTITIERNATGYAQHAITVDLQEVMLPYLQIEGRTIWERYQESEQHAITTGGPE